MPCVTSLHMFHCGVTIKMLLLILGCTLCLLFRGDAECDKEWLHYGQSCYFISKTHETWQHADFFCKAKQAELASIEDVHENNFLTDAILSIKNRINKRWEYDNDFWIGGTDNVTEGQWVWEATGKPLTYTNWVPGQGLRRDEDCLEIVQWNDRVGQWNDDNCSDKSRFICEKEF